jgi:hypothetical protein
VSTSPDMFAAYDTSPGLEQRVEGATALQRVAQQRAHAAEGKQESHRRLRERAGRRSKAPMPRTPIFSRLNLRQQWIDFTK